MTSGPFLVGMHALLLGVLVTTVPLDGQAQSSPARFAYLFDCAGQYLRIDVNTGEHTQLRSVPGIAPGAGAFDGCLVQALAVDPESSVVYAVMPTQRFVDSLGQSKYTVTALQLPTLHTLSSVDTSASTDHMPKLRLDNLAHTLTVGYRTQNVSTTAKSVQYVISTVDPEHLKFETQPGSTNAVARETSGRLLSNSAYVQSSGRIIDGNRVIAANGNVSSITGYELMTDSLRQRFQDLQRNGATGNKYLDIVFADSAGGRMLFIVAWDTLSDQSPAGGGLVVYDAANDKVISSFTTPYRETAFELTSGTPTVQLTPDGQVAIVEEYQWQQPEGASNQQRFKTGKVALYDATSGNLVSTIQLDPAPGNSGRVVGFSADSTLMYYASTQNLYVVDLSRKQSLTIKLPVRFSPSAVVTATR